MTTVKCTYCEYAFFDPAEKDEFVFVDDKPYCIQCLKDAIELSDKVRADANLLSRRIMARMPRKAVAGAKGAITIMEESS